MIVHSFASHLLILTEGGRHHHKDQEGESSDYRLRARLRGFLTPLVAGRFPAPRSSSLCALSASFIHCRPSPGLFRLIVPGPTRTISSSLSLSPISNNTGILKASISNSPLAGSIVRTSTASSSKSNLRLRISSIGWMSNSSSCSRYSTFSSTSAKSGASADQRCGVIIDQRYIRPLSRPHAPINGRCGCHCRESVSEKTHQA